MKKILILLLTVFLLFACDFDSSKVERIPVSGAVVTESMSFDDFSTIVIAGPMDITLDQNQGSSIEVETYESLMQFFRAEIINDALVLYVLDTSKTMHFDVEDGYNHISSGAILSGSRLKWPKNEKVLNVHVSYADLDKIKIIGECSIKTQQTMVTEELKLDVAGALHMEADLKLKVFQAEIAGAGSLNLRGSAEKFYVECAGAGTIKAYDFMANSVKLEIAGVCNAHVYAKESIDVSMAGLGTVKYKGNPGDISVDKSGVGSVKSAETEEKEQI